MDAEVEAYSRRIGSLLDRVCSTLEGLTDEHLNWRPPLDEANSAYVIAAHVFGNVRAWVLGVACGLLSDRDRPAEFRAAGSYGELVDGAARLSRDVKDALEALPPSQLDRTVVPSQELWGEGEPYEISAREALIEVIEHAGVHLGQLQITRDLALREGAL